MTYGENKGQLVATLDTSSSDGQMVLILDDAFAVALLEICADKIAQAASEKAIQFRDNFLKSITPTIKDPF